MTTDLVDSSETRARLAQIETDLRELDPCSDRYWELMPERAALRDAIDIGWRDEHGYGARSGRPGTLPWGDDVRCRWRALRAYLEDYRGVRVGDAPLAPTSARLEKLEAEHGAFGTSVRQWVSLLDAIQAEESWMYVFRDALGFQRVRGVYFSLLQQGEADYHWAVALDEIGEADPPVHGFVLDHEAGRFVPGPPHHQYGGYQRVTDFARAMLEAYADHIGAHPRVTSITHQRAKGTAGRTWAAPIAPQPTPEELRTRDRLVSTPRAEVLRALHSHGVTNPSDDDLLADLFDDATLDEVFDLLSEAPLDAFRPDEDEMPATVGELIEYVGRGIGPEIERA
jgi:hypothetical protein